MDKKPKKLVPEVRFKGFTDDWEQRKLGKVACINPKTNIPDNFKYVDLESVVGTSLIKAKLTTKQLAPSRAQRVAKKGDIFYQTVRPYQKNNFLFDINNYDFQYVFSTGYAQLRSEINNYFLFSYLQRQRFVNLILRRSTGTSYPAISSKDLSEIKIIFPRNSKEQENIGKIINLIDALITLQQRKLNQLKQLKKAMLQYLLTTEKKSAPLIRNKNYNNKWDTTTFSKLLNYERPENYIVTNTNYRKNGIPVLTANKSFILGYTNEPNVYNKGEAIIFDDFTLENKFVNFPFMIKSSAIKILTSKVNYSLYFIFQLLQHTKFIKEGHARHYISVVQKQIVKIPPSYEEQESISDTFSRIQSLIKLQQNKIDQYTTLKKYLLQKMFI
ncbi:restriction endonuclease subunit S [Limosilactobacillus reuteri]|uniref:restriction endonuclease subunit S n=1 Tax=Limosilactobacillus reuteri TaxID=1598 RepID=UPI002551CD0C|nr:restriction endonuclease subunit S [Limosilactobacillus reuteri]MDL2056940.1 restriction endonuclease subunit S [Limosilactobacillus reuteri]